MKDCNVCKGVGEISCDHGGEISARSTTIATVRPLGSVRKRVNTMAEANPKTLIEQAREIAARVHEIHGFKVEADRCRSGDFDEWSEIQSALAALQSTAAEMDALRADNTRLRKALREIVPLCDNGEWGNAMDTAIYALKGPTDDAD
jgi:hypothetical protein